MTLVSEHVEPDTRERILVVAERLFRQIGYQKTTVADIAKELRMSPANVYRFFDSKKSIHEGVCRTLMGEVEGAAAVIMQKPGSASERLRRPYEADHGDHRRRNRAGRRVGRVRCRRRGVGGVLHLPRHDRLFPSA